MKKCNGIKYRCVVYIDCELVLNIDCELLLYRCVKY